MLLFYLYIFIEKLLSMKITVFRLLFILQICNNKAEMP